MQVTGSSSLSRAGLARVEVTATAGSRGEPGTREKQLRHTLRGQDPARWERGWEPGRPGVRVVGGAPALRSRTSTALWGEDGALLACRCLDGHPCHRQRPVPAGQRAAGPPLWPGPAALTACLFSAWPEMGGEFGERRHSAKCPVRDLAFLPAVCRDQAQHWPVNITSGGFLPPEHLW